LEPYRMSCFSRPSFCSCYRRIFPFWDGDEEGRVRVRVGWCESGFFAERGEGGMGE
jgi:hypothetical protein